MLLRSLIPLFIATFGFITTASATEEVRIGGIQISVSEECLMTFNNSQGHQTEWQFPADGPCYLSKDRKGRVDIYQHYKDSSLEAPRLILMHASKRINKRGCESQSVAIMIKEGRIFVSLPPYMRFAGCVGPKSGVDQKNFSYHWFSIQEEANHMELRFR